MPPTRKFLQTPMTCLFSLKTSKIQSILNDATHLIVQRPSIVCSHICLHSGNFPLAHCAPVHSVQNSNTYAQLFGLVNFFILSEVMTLGLFTPWSLHPPLSAHIPEAKFVSASRLTNRQHNYTIRQSS